MSMQRGRFIVFEGIDGCGKSTQAALLFEHMQRLGMKVKATREPGGTITGNAIRQLLLQGDAQQREPLTDILLMSAARHEHVVHTIRPALDAGYTVVCDRFVDSTYAYQVAGQGADADIARTIRDAVCGDCMPDDVIIIDISPDIAAQRLRSSDKEKDDETYYERIGDAFYQRVRQGFLACAEGSDDHRKRSRYHIADGTMQQDILASYIIDRLYAHSSCA